MSMAPRDSRSERGLPADPTASHPSLGLGIALARRAARRPHRVRPGAHVGGYLIGPMLGNGGMGEVFRATHRLLGRPAAIKIIRPESLIDVDDDDLFLTLRRFRREAKVAASLRSPHAVQLYDYGLTQEGIFYIVMELLPGLDLEQLVERFGPVPAERAIHLLRQACTALTEMHARGLTHRDIKPSNLHVCRAGLHHDFVKVTDLGLVKPARGTTDEHRILQRKGRILGTPAHIPPELALGEQGDERTDIYALGCVGYWLLTGCTVFEARTAAELLLQHVRHQPEAPSRRTELDIPAALERLILRSLEKEPEQRPQSVGEVARELEACEVQQAWTEERAGRWWDAHLPNDEAVAVG